MNHSVTFLVLNHHSWACSDVNITSMLHTRVQQKYYHCVLRSYKKKKLATVASNLNAVPLDFALGLVSESTSGSAVQSS